MKDTDRLTQWISRRNVVMHSKSDHSRIQTLLDKIDFEIRILMKWLFIEKI